MPPLPTHSIPLSLCYVTPTFGRDIERFALLRRSLALFSPDIPHLACVDTEDCALFERRFGQERNLRIIPTAEILPPALEAERRLWRSWRGRLAERVGWRLKLGPHPFTGWKMQQIVKLDLLADLPYAAAVFLDSDIVLCGPVTAEDYFEAGRLRLLETPALTYEDYFFEVGRQILIGGDLQAPMQGLNYIHQAPRFLSRTGATLRRHLEAHHRDWRRKFFQQAFPAEYQLLGYAARVLENGEGYCPEPLPPDEWLYCVKETAHLEPQLMRCQAERGRRKFLLVQSNLGLPEAEYLPRIFALIEQITANPAPAREGLCHAE